MSVRVFKMVPRYLMTKRWTMAASSLERKWKWTSNSSEIPTINKMLNY